MNPLNFHCSYMGIVKEGKYWFITMDEGNLCERMYVWALMVVDDDDDDSLFRNVNDGF